MVMSEPMDRSKRLFGQLTNSFEEAFPTIESATISSYEVGGGVHAFGIDKSRRESFGEGVPFVEGLIPCSNAHCRRGGFEVDRSLRSMVGDKLTEKIFASVCPGDEGSPKGRRAGKRCYNVLNYRLRVKYKSEGSKVL
jgi:hypothetical protein